MQVGPRRAEGLHEGGAEGRGQDFAVVEAVGGVAQ